MREGKSLGDRLFSLGSYLYLTIFMIFCLFPFWIMIVASFTKDIVLREDGYLPWARIWSLEAYNWVFKGSEIQTGYMVTIFITVVGTLCSLFVMSGLAYLMAVKRFKGRNKVAFYVFFTMIFVPSLIPWFITVRNLLHLHDNIWAPDFTMAFDAPWNKMNSLRDQGALSPIEGMIDAKGPKLKEEITEKIYNVNFTKGHLYGIPTAFYYGGTGGALFREDLRQKYNADKPTSEGGWASLESFLAAVQKNAPDMISFVNVPTQSIVTYGPRLRALAPGVPKTGVIIPDATTDWKLIDEEDFEADANLAKLVRTWWEKGYLNKTDVPFSGTSQNSEVDYIFPGKAAACVENEPEYKQVEYTKQMKSSNKDATLAGVDLTGMRAGKTKPLGALKQWNFIVFNVNAPQAQQEAGIAYFNWLASSQDNMDLWLMGIDGKNYKKEADLKFSEIEGVDAARNYRRQWYVSGISGRFQRQPVELPQDAQDALKFFTTESNWDFNPYESFEPDTKALEVDAAKLNGIYDEAVHGFMSGQVATDEAVKAMKKQLDDAGRQTYKEKLQKQLDDYIAAHKA